MKPYLDLMRNIRNNGKYSMDRTGTGRHRIFGTQSRYDLSNGTLPVVTTRQIFLGAIIKELLWFISGSFDARKLEEQDVNIWKKWTVRQEHIKEFAKKYKGEEGEQAVAELEAYWTQNAEGTIGEMYGAMWRNAPRDSIHHFWPTPALEDLPSDKLKEWKINYESYLKASAEEEVKLSFEEFCKYTYYHTVDQLNELMVNLRKRPFSSRLVVNAWVPSHIPFEELTPQENVLLNRGSLAPCHAMFQCFVTPAEVDGGKHKLSLMMTQRSVDLPVGAPYNIAQYSLLLALIAHCSDMEPDEFIWSTGDTHIYSNQLPWIDEQLSREPLPSPKLWLNPDKKDIFDFKFEDIRIEGYQSHSKIDYPVAT